MDSCYICEEEENTVTYRVCLCDRRVHDRCFRELVSRVESHREECPVCRTRYATSPACEGRTTLRVAGNVLFTFTWLFVVYDICIMDFPTIISTIVFVILFLWSLCNLWLSIERPCVSRIRCARDQGVVVAPSPDAPPRARDPTA